MTRRPLLPALLVPALLCPPAALAAGDFAACTVIVDPTQRLACFDAAARAAPAPPASASAASLRAPPPPPSPAEQEASFGKHIVPERDTTEATFGRVPPPPPPPPDEPPEPPRLDEISSTVAGAGKDSQGRLVLILANDQEWVVTGYDHLLPPRPNTAVSVERNFLGNYLVNVYGSAYQAFRQR